MIIARRNSVIGWGLLAAMMVVTLLPFVSMFTSALAPSGTYPLGVSWPAHPQWGNFVQAFRGRRHGRHAPVEHGHCRRGRPRIGAYRHFGGVRSRPLTGTRRSGGVCVVPARADVALRRRHRADLLRNTAYGSARKPLGHYPAADRVVHALRRLLDACPFHQRVQTSCRKPLMSTAPRPGNCSGGCRCRWPGPLLYRSGSCCQYGPGTSSCCR